MGYAITALTGEEKAIANWANPEIAGISNCMGDIGTHAENLVHYITGLEIDKLCADFSVNIPGRKLDDDGNVLVRFKGGVKGIIYASQVSNGDENDLNIRVYGTKKSIEWHQEEPNDLLVKDARAPRQVWRYGNDYVTGAAAENTRIPFGHPEGFIEAFANVYNAAAVAISDEVVGKYPRKSGYDFPDIRDGIIGMAFIETVVKSSKSKDKWVKFPTLPKNKLMSKKIGIIGAGGMLQYHAAGFRTGGADLIAICDMNETAAKSAAAEYEVPHVFSDSAKMLSELSDLDAISIITPNRTHTVHSRFRLWRQGSMCFVKSALHLMQTR